MLPDVGPPRFNTSGLFVITWSLEGGSPEPTDANSRLALRVKSIGVIYAAFFSISRRVGASSAMDIPPIWRSINNVGHTGPIWKTIRRPRAVSSC